MAIRTYLIFKDGNTELLNTQIFGNNFWDTTFFNEIMKLTNLKGEFPMGDEVEVPFEEVFKLMEDVVRREIKEYPTKLIDKYDFDDGIFENKYSNSMLNFTNDFVSRDDLTSDEPLNVVEPYTELGIAYKINYLIQLGKIFQTYDLVNKLLELDLLTSKNPMRIFRNPVLKDDIKCFISQYWVLTFLIVCDILSVVKRGIFVWLFHVSEENSHQIQR